MAQILDLEVLNDALSFEIEKFREYGYVRWAHGSSLNYASNPDRIKI
jgi:hypothetical protein